MNESEIPFPLLAGNNILYKGKYYKIVNQGKLAIFSYPYVLTPGQKITSISLHNAKSETSIFAVNENEMKEFTTWIDNEYLGVLWEINNTNITSLSGVDSPLTLYTNPYGSSNFPLFSIKNSTGNVTLDLVNLNSVAPIAGAIKVVIYTYTIAEIAKPDIYTAIEYGD